MRAEIVGCRSETIAAAGSFPSPGNHPEFHSEGDSHDRQIIVATFNDTNAAYDAASAIKGLKDACAADFKLKTGVMIKKDDRGNVALLESKDRHLLGTAVGTITGALIGLIGGAPGMALGAALGATTGLSGDVVMEALDSDFVDSVTTDMRPGMTAIIVEANEGSTRAVDDIVALGGGHVYRQAA
jgi:uncharacterized membrane protein